jgi:hypothetical protein
MAGPVFLQFRLVVVPAAVAMSLQFREVVLMVIGIMDEIIGNHGGSRSGA